MNQDKCQKHLFSRSFLSMQLLVVCFFPNTMRSAYMGLGLYGFSGYKGNFWVDPNGMGIYII